MKKLISSLRRAISILTILFILFLSVGCAKSKMVPKTDTVKKEKPAVEKTAEKGKDLFMTKKCISCHKLKGTGGEIGPDLTYVGSVKDKTWLDQWLKDPVLVKPDAKMPRPNLTEEERKVLVEFLAEQK